MVDPVPGELLSIDYLLIAGNEGSNLWSLYIPEYSSLVGNR